MRNELRLCDHPSASGTDQYLFGQQIFRCDLCNVFYIWAPAEFDHRIELVNRLIKELSDA